ncbi:MAG: class I SAM-dependent methyltransferase [Acidimicrobiia bacterium]|nr:class I SAM-dependent methyltransferase [Acidimicrobiia bacterium]
MFDRLDPRGLLAKPWVYKTFRGLVTTKAGRAGLVEDYLRPRPGDSVLDIGCGTADVLDDLPDVEYYGFDSSEEYIDLARARHGNRGTFVHASVSRDTVTGKFDLVMALGVLHHLNDGDAADLFALASSALKPTGRLVTLDPLFHDGQAAHRRFVVSLDRGGHIRILNEYIELAQRSFQEIESHTRTDLLRIPYTHLILECSP